MQSDTRTKSVFRDENQAAKEGSERARQKGRRERPEIIQLEMFLPRSRDTRNSLFGANQSESTYYWLKEQPVVSMPEQLARDWSSRAVERFFADWTKVPCEDGISIGCELDLPILYSSTMRNSILWLAVDTMALAHVGHLEPRGLSEPRGALKRYGETLSALYELAYDNRAFAGVDVIAGILLLDTFEVRPPTLIPKA